MLPCQLLKSRGCDCGSPFLIIPVITWVSREAPSCCFPGLARDVITQEADDGGSKHGADTRSWLRQKRHCHQRRRGQLIPARRGIGQPQSRKPRTETLRSVTGRPRRAVGFVRCRAGAVAWSWGTGPHCCPAAGPGLLPSWHACIHHWRTAGFPKLLGQKTGEDTLHCTTLPSFHSLLDFLLWSSFAATHFLSRGDIVSHFAGFSKLGEQWRLVHAQTIIAFKSLYSNFLASHLGDEIHLQISPFLKIEDTATWAHLVNEKAGLEPLCHYSCSSSS